MIWQLPITWTAIDGADQYQIWITRTATNESPYLLEFTDSPSFTPAEDLPIGRYVIWVRMHNLDGTTGRWNQPVTIQVDAVPVIVPLELHQATRRPTVSWNAVDGAAAYDVWVNNTGCSRVIDVYYAAFLRSVSSDGEFVSGSVV